jgi:carboxyl-terminal processing protease
MFGKYRDIALGVVAGALITAVVYGFIPKPLTAGDLPRSLPFTPQQLAIMRETKAALAAYQVDGDQEGKVDDTKMYHGAMKGLVASVGDPYTRFVAPKDLEEEKISLEGEYGGLGIYITSRDGHTTVVAPIEGTPADRAGMQPLDEIVKVDDKSVVGKTSDEVVKLLRGPAGKSVTVHVRRKDEGKLLEFKMVREMIKIKTVRLEMQGDIAYIKINQFNFKTNKEMEDILKKVKAKKAKGILLDLRNNPGGVIDAVVDVTSQLIDKGVVVGMKGRVSQANHVYYASEGKATDLPLVALVNEGSASAAEILAGALKDHKRGTIVGMKTFGKGSVQSLFSLPDKSGIYITIARYSTPSGYILDKKGLEPDVRMGGHPEKDKKKDKQYQKGLAILKKEMAKKKK